MKIKSAKLAIISLLIVLTGSMTVILNSCTVSQKIEAKPGVQLWAENCQRCHNTPSSNTFSHDQWETIGLHMQSRALLTNKERDKIVDFLKQ